MTDSPRPEPSPLYRWLVLIFVSLAMFGNYYAYDMLSSPEAYSSGSSGSAR